MNKKILLWSIIMILITVSANALTLQVEEARVYSPEEQKLTIDLGKTMLPPDFKDVSLKLEIFGSATFDNGNRVKEYTYQVLDKKKILEEIISLDVESSQREETIRIQANMKYTVDLPFGFSKTNEPSKSINFFGIWQVDVNCQEELRQCEDSEKKLQETNNELNGQIGGLEGDVFSLEEKKSGLENRIIDLEGQLDECNTSKTEIEQKIPEEGCSTVAILGFSVPIGLLVLALVGCIIYIFVLRKKNKQLEGQVQH